MSAGTERIEPLTHPMGLGEGPYWMENDSSLVFVDHPGHCVNRFNTQTKRLQVMEIDTGDPDACPSFIIPVAGHAEAFVIGLGHDVVVAKWSRDEADKIRRKPTPIVTVDQHLPNNALNDAKVDHQGRLWAGTKGREVQGDMEMRKGTLYSIEPKNLKFKDWVHEITVSNGMTWSLDRRTYFYIDSPTRTVSAFDYDEATGHIGNRRIAVDFENIGVKGYPDGMTIDMNGHLWVACYDGGQVVCLDPSTGKLLRSVRTPSRYTTSCCFGGNDYSTLFVTTATRWMSDQELANDPDSGKTLAITGLGAKGQAERGFPINLSMIKF